MSCGNAVDGKVSPPPLNQSYEDRDMETSSCSRQDNSPNDSSGGNISCSQVDSRCEANSCNGGKSHSPSSKLNRGNGVNSSSSSIESSSKSNSGNGVNSSSCSIESSSKSNSRNGVNSSSCRMESSSKSNSWNGVNSSSCSMESSGKSNSGNGVNSCSMEGSSKLKSGNAANSLSWSMESNSKSNSGNRLNSSSWSMEGSNSNSGNGVNSSSCSLEGSRKLTGGSGVNSSSCSMEVSSRSNSGNGVSENNSSCSKEVSSKSSSGNRVNSSSCIMKGSSKPTRGNGVNSSSCSIEVSSKTNSGNRVNCSSCSKERSSDSVSCKVLNRSTSPIKSSNMLDSCTGGDNGVNRYYCEFESVSLAKSSNEVKSSKGQVRRNCMSRNCSWAEEECSSCVPASEIVGTSGIAESPSEVPKKSRIESYRYSGNIEHSTEMMASFSAMSVIDDFGGERSGADCESSVRRADYLNRVENSCGMLEVSGVGAEISNRLNSIEERTGDTEPLKRVEGFGDLSENSSNEINKRKFEEELSPQACKTECSTSESMNSSVLPSSTTAVKTECFSALPALDRSEMPGTRLSVPQHSIIGEEGHTTLAISRRVEIADSATDARVGIATGTIGPQLVEVIRDGAWDSRVKRAAESKVHSCSRLKHALSTGTYCPTVETENACSGINTNIAIKRAEDASKSRGSKRREGVSSESDSKNIIMAEFAKKGIKNASSETEIASKGIENASDGTAGPSIEINGTSCETMKASCGVEPAVSMRVESITSEDVGSHGIEDTACSGPGGSGFESVRHGVQHLDGLTENVTTKKQSLGLPTNNATPNFELDSGIESPGSGSKSSIASSPGGIESSTVGMEGSRSEMEISSISGSEEGSPGSAIVSIDSGIESSGSGAESPGCETERASRGVVSPDSETVESVNRDESGSVNAESRGGSGLDSSSMGSVDGSVVGNPSSGISSAGSGIDSPISAVSSGIESPRCGIHSNGNGIERAGSESSRRTDIPKCGISSSCSGTVSPSSGKGTICPPTSISDQSEVSTQQSETESETSDYPYSIPSPAFSACLKSTRSSVFPLLGPACRSGRTASREAKGRAKRTRSEEGAGGMAGAKVSLSRRLTVPGSGPCGLLNVRVSVAKLPAATLLFHQLSMPKVSPRLSPSTADRTLPIGASSQHPQLSSGLLFPPRGDADDGAACDNADRDRVKRSASPRASAVCCPPAVKRVKVEQASSEPALRTDRALKCDFVTFPGNIMKKSDLQVTSCAGSSNCSSLTVGLLLKRENSVDETKFVLSDSEVAAERKEAKGLLLNAAAATAEEMKAEIAQIDSILKGRLLIPAAPLKEEEVESHPLSPKEGFEPTPMASDHVAEPSPALLEVERVNCKWTGCSLEMEDTHLLDHLTTVHVVGQSGDGGKVQCLWAGCKVYGALSSSSTWLTSHVTSHSGNKPFRCIVDACRQRFASQLALSRHVNSHFKPPQNPPGTPPNHHRRFGAGGHPDASAAPLRFLVRKTRRKQSSNTPASGQHRCLADSLVDPFHVGVMAGVRDALARMKRRPRHSRSPTAINFDGSGTAVIFYSRVLGRRVDENGNLHYLISWLPAGMLEEEWVAEENLKIRKKVSIIHLPPAAKSAVEDHVFGRKLERKWPRKTRPYQGPPKLT